MLGIRLKKILSFKFLARFKIGQTFKKYWSSTYMNVLFKFDKI